MKDKGIENNLKGVVKWSKRNIIENTMHTDLNFRSFCKLFYYI